MSRSGWRVAALAVLVGLTGGACDSPGGPPGPTAASTAPTPDGTSEVPSEPTPAVSVDSYAPTGWVDLSTVDPTILRDIRYHGPHNFLGRPVAGYLEPLCVLPVETAQALHRVQVAALAEGYSLKMYDCYRPVRAGADFVAWRDTPDQATKAEFYPSLEKRQLFSLGFVGGGSTSHSSGSAVDLTLVRLPATPQRPYVPGEPLVACVAPVDQRFPDNSVDMGTGYDCFDQLSHTMDARITGAARDNRLRLRRLMESGGFVNYQAEWWHYDLANAPYPGRYFDFPIASAALPP
jgi:D-alanyl-D-alanine dipeptidase